MRKRTEEDLEIAAERTRARLGVSDQTNPDMMTLIVKMKSLWDYQKLSARTR